jgi:hypothetical protein
MLTNVRHFYAVKVFCLLAVVASAQVTLKNTKPSTQITPIQWVVIAMGLWAIPSGFLVERQILGRTDRPSPRTSRSTPLSRWRASNVVRAMSATSVALWGLILRESGGPVWLAYSFLGLGGLLVLIWKPTATPQELQGRQNL